MKSVCRKIVLFFLICTMIACFSCAILVFADSGVSGGISTNPEDYSIAEYSGADVSLTESNNGLKFSAEATFAAWYTKEKNIDPSALKFETAIVSAGGGWQSFALVSDPSVYSGYLNESEIVNDGVGIGFRVSYFPSEKTYHFNIDILGKGQTQADAHIAVVSAEEGQVLSFVFEESGVSVNGVSLNIPTEIWSPYAAADAVYFGMRREPGTSACEVLFGNDIKLDGEVEVPETTDLPSAKSDYTAAATIGGTTFSMAKNCFILEQSATANAYVSTNAAAVNPKNLTFEIALIDVENDWAAIVLGKTKETVSEYSASASSNTGLGVRLKWLPEENHYRVFLDLPGKQLESSFKDLPVSTARDAVLKFVFSEGKVTIAGTEIELPAETYENTGAASYFGIKVTPGTSSEVGKVVFGNLVTLPSDSDNEGGAETMSLNAADYEGNVNFSMKNGGLFVSAPSNSLPVRYFSTLSRVNPKSFSFRTIIKSTGNQWVSFVMGNSKTVPSDYLNVAKDGGFGIRIQTSAENGNLVAHLDALPGGADVLIVDLGMKPGTEFEVKFGDGFVSLGETKISVPWGVYHLLNDQKNAYFGMKVEPQPGAEQENSAEVLFGYDFKPSLISSDESKVGVSDDSMKIYLMTGMTVAEFKNTVAADYVGTCTIEVKDGSSVLADDAQMKIGLKVVLTSGDKTAEYEAVDASLGSTVNFQKDSFTAATAKIEDAFGGIQVNAKNNANEPDAMSFAVAVYKTKVNAMNVSFKLHITKEAFSGTNWIAITMGSQTAPYTYNEAPQATDNCFGVRFLYDRAGQQLLAKVDGVKDGVFMNGDAQTMSAEFPQDGVLDIVFSYGKVKIGGITLTVPSAYYELCSDPTNTYMGMKIYGLSKFTAFELSNKFSPDFSSSDNKVQLTDGKAELTEKMTVADLRKVLKAIEVGGNELSYDVCNSQGQKLQETDIVLTGTVVSIPDSDVSYTVKINTVLSIDSEDVLLDSEEVFTFIEITVGQLKEMIQSSYADYTISVVDENGAEVADSEKLKTGWKVVVTGAADTFDPIALAIKLDQSLEEDNTNGSSENPDDTQGGCSAMNITSSVLVSAAAILVVAVVICRKKRQWRF